MTKEELININGIREDLYQAMQIGDITLSSKNSQKLVDFMNYQDKEIERLNNIIKELEKELDRGYLDLFAHELVPGRELITNIKNYLQELKKNGQK